MANIASVLQRFLFILAAALTAAAWPTASRAVEAGIFYTSGNLTKEAPGETPGLYLNANFALHLPTQAEESLKRGRGALLRHRIRAHEKALVLDG